MNDGTDDSAANYNMTINVTAANDPPTAADNRVTTAEDTPYTFTADDFNFSDADTGDALSGVKITTPPQVGAFALDGVPVTADQVVPRPDIDAGKLRFTPAANANGNAYASFAFTVNDGTDDSAANYNMTIDVTAANDPPTAAHKTVTTAEDTPYTFTADDFNFSDADTGDSLVSVKITSSADGRDVYTRRRHSDRGTRMVAQGRRRRRQAALHPGGERQRRRLRQLHLHGERRHRRQRRRSTPSPST